MELRSKNKVQPNMVYGRFNIKRKSYLHLNARTNKVAIVNKALIYLYMSKQFGKYYKYNINIFCIEINNFVFRPHNVYYSKTQGL